MPIKREHRDPDTRVKTFPITDEDRATFVTDPRDTGLSAHVFTRLCDVDEQIRTSYVEDFGIAHSKLWVAFRRL